MRERTRRASLALLTPAIGAAVILFFEWQTDEVLVVLPVLLVASFASGFIVPKSYGLVGPTLGLTIVSAHALSTATGIFAPRYQTQAPLLADWVMMTALVAPAFATAFLGSQLRLLMIKTK